MPPYTAFTTFTAASTVVAASVPKPFISTVRQLNMANTSGNFSNFSSKVDTCSARLSAVETEADVGLVSTTQTSRLTSSIHKHCSTATKEEKDHTKKIYFCKYCPP
jgi:polyisoprenoid-binding protein YceI